jgi:Tannase and feruloyl esterase
MNLGYLHHAHRISMYAFLSSLCFCPTSMGSAGPVTPTAPCGSLLKLKLPHTTITVAKSETGESYRPPTWDVKGPPRPSTNDLPPFCRVAADIKPTPDSNIKIEVWMPVAGWNGKFEGVGNGGWSGQIWYPYMGLALRKGYATASTDTGHQGTGEDANFAMGHPEKVVDFGYRAVHEMTIKARAIIAAYYGGPPKFSYWDGCSSGGKQGLKEAQRYPNDYDGIIAGAPANNWTHLLASGVWIAQSNHNGEAVVLSNDNLALLHRAALDSCDLLDGLKDGLISNPSDCDFDPGKLLCKGTDRSACLTHPQVEAAEKIYAGPTNPRTGEQVFPGLEPGSELGWFIFGSFPEPPIVASHFKYLVFNDPTWDFRKLNFDADISLADRLDNGVITATDPDLRKFFAHGGKLILYHGWSDPMISPLNTISYYKNVLKTSGNQAEASVRLFMAPGMDHCGGGEGPFAFDMDDALSQWVEQDKAPALIVAAHLPADSAAHAQDRTRPLCAYPRVAKYKGTGSIDDASNFHCMRQ